MIITAVTFVGSKANILEISIRNLEIKYCRLFCVFIVVCVCVCVRACVGAGAGAGAGADTTRGGDLYIIKELCVPGDERFARERAAPWARGAAIGGRRRDGG